MKLIICTVSNEDFHILSEELRLRGIKATPAGTTEGVLDGQFTTLLIPAEAQQVEGILNHIEAICHTRPQNTNPLPPMVEPGEIAAPASSETQVGGATVFVVNLDQVARY